MHARTVLLTALALSILPLSGCIGVANMGELRSELTEGRTAPPSVVPPSPEPPVAVLEASNRPARVDQLVAFNGTGSRDPDGRIVAWNWSIDGSPEPSSSQLFRTFHRAGTHRVALTVVDDDGLTDRASLDLEVHPDRPPRAGFVIRDADGDPTGRVTVGEPVVLTGTSSVDPEGGSLEYEWGLDDDTTAEGEVVRHTYDRGGRRVVALTVVDAGGNRDTATRMLAVDQTGSVQDLARLQDPVQIGIPVAPHAKAVRVQLTYEADVPLEDLDLTLESPSGASTTAPDEEDPTPGRRTVEATVDDPPDGEWIAEVTVDTGWEKQFTVAWRVTY